MKKISLYLLLLITAFFTLTGCKKNKNTLEPPAPAKYYIQFWVKSKPYLLRSASANLKESASSKFFIFDLYSSNKSASSSEVFHFSIINKERLKANTTFSFIPFPENDDDDRVDNIQFFSSVGGQDYTLDKKNVNGDFTIKITEVSTSTIKGAFSGKFIDEKFVSTYMTEGEFFATYDPK